MKFSRCQVQSAAGHKLAHSHMGKSRRIPKASILSEFDIRDLIEAGVDSVEIVIAEAFDIIEDIVAERLVRTNELEELSRGARKWGAFQYLCNLRWTDSF